jgi:hypothetical protein
MEFSLCDKYNSYVHFFQIVTMEQKIKDYAWNKKLSLLLANIDFLMILLLKLGPKKLLWPFLLQ